MGKDTIDNDFYDDADDDIAEAESGEETENDNTAEEKTEIDEGKFFSPEPDEKDGEAKIESFLDEPEDGEKSLLSDEFEESEEETARKKKAGKRVAIISACSVFVIAVCVFAFVFINRYMNRFIMTVDGQKISVEEFKLYYYANQDAEDSKNTALSSLKQCIVIENEAKARNIAMTAEERQEVMDSLQDFKDYFNSLGYDMPDISDERLIEILGVDKIYTKLYESMTANYTVDDSDYDAQYEDYLVNGKADYIDAQYQYIMAETEENAQKAKEALETGTDINEIMAQYSLDYAEGDEVPTIGIYEISYYFTPENTEHALSLSAGQVSDVIEFSGTYIIFKMEYITIPTGDEIKELFSGQYYDEKKYYMFLDEFDSIQSAAEEVTKLNQKLFDTFA